jgi:hypothetical protein
MSKIPTNLLNEIKIIPCPNFGNYKGKVFNVPFEGHYKAWGIIVNLRTKENVKGIVNAHWHKGFYKNYDPQEVAVVRGKIKMYFESLDGKKAEFEVKEGEKILVPKYTLHTYELLSDETIYIEPKDHQYNPDKEDTHYEEDFRKLQRVLI